MTVHIAIPAMNEADYISSTMNALKQQLFDGDIRIYVCVNQPDNYWNDAVKRPICDNNQRTIEILEHFDSLDITILDHTSKGKGWGEKKFGVGMARKVLMDFISNSVPSNDVVISLDADTLVEPLYVQSIVHSFTQYPKAVAISVPYFHLLTGKPAEDRAILRYEIYMRNYAIQMLRINAPFAFTALGSAMAFRIAAYRAIGGMSPMKSGEDFYFLQQLKKYGTMLIFNQQKVFPAARFSNRVFFGTGPAMIKGNEGNWTSYPIYHYSLFDEVNLLCAQVAKLYHQNMDDSSRFYNFLQLQFKENDFLKPIRKNCSTETQFLRAFYTKVDGLRILQFLKFYHEDFNLSDRQLLVNNYPELSEICNQYAPEIELTDFSIQNLSEIRLKLVEIEDELLSKKILLSSL